ncbi:MAG: HNH endonuclease [Saprospiraceae bacterium]
MNRRAIPLTIRQAVAERANCRYEYCLMLEAEFFVAFEIDHIVSLKHGGSNDLENLAFACPHCNQHKGSDLGTYVSESNRLTRLFHPRKDTWEKHFEVDEGEIMPLTKIGAATIKVLDINNPDRIILRRLLIQAGRYP